VAERLRRLTRITTARNQIPSGSVGSNPTICENCFNPDPIVAQQLRRLTKIRPTRNQIPSGSVGSNSTNCENFFNPDPNSIF
jgi:hypothetical protein